MLATCLRVLRAVHEEFFQGTGGDAGGGAAGAEGEGAGAAGPACNGGGGGGAAGAGAAERRAPTKRRRLRGGSDGGPDGPGGGGGGGGGGAAAALDPSALRGRDVRTCLADARARVLRGCCVAFSRCWPQYVSPFDQPLWALAEGLGADCSTHYSAGRTTHVVAAPDRGGELPLTDKVQAARRDGVHVVHYDWLLASKFRWARRRGTTKLNWGPLRLAASAAAAAAAAVWEGVWHRADEAGYEMPAYVQSGRAAGAKARGFSWQPAGGERDARIAAQAAGRAG
ncbi:hypothetical protein MNEG_15131 [Monoraphidium neglectum]|uniref:protein-serine/threonine phosphatase n=1 Tax=Monoraphidium neglectum TaxID=145388 RepID=A0A0D2K9U8_9CHLO|nr:hypothetical protein MNEG_15131 [Monoraphidium neglectum]KIY92833.1 hypothetical protein MNEG_15131 [Monoraphidium neglectum]|eukprot:XP_013891853.1 hypothetical protein MNEG_15131 [Monoraphidium neglectum]